jgi:hypothetical protein
MKKNLECLKNIKEELCAKRMEVSKLRKSNKWKIEDVKKVLSSLKDGK